MFDNNMPSDDELMSAYSRRNMDSIPGVSDFNDGPGADSFNEFDGFNDFGGFNGGMGPYGAGPYDSFPPGAPGGFGGGFSQSYDLGNNKPQAVNDDPWVLTFLKSCCTFIKEVFGSLSDFKGSTKVKFGQFVFYAGLLWFVVGLVGIFFPVISTTQFIAAGFFSLGLGGYSLLAGAQEVGEPESMSMSEAGLGEGDANSVGTFSREIEDDFLEKDPAGFSSIYDEDEEDLDSEEPSSFYDDEDEDFAGPSQKSSFNFTEYTGLNATEGASKESVVTAEEILSKVASGGSGLVTRRYLLDCANPLLESITPNYAVSKTLPEDSKEFLALCDWVEQAARIVGGKLPVEEIPKVLSVTDSLFYLKCVITRPRWFSGAKVEQFEKELRNFCAYNEATGMFDEGVTVASNQVGSRAYIKIMKGETALITIKDILAENEEFFLDTKNKQPVIWGVDDNGCAVINDFNKLTGLFLSGAPRTGKSWAVKSIISQLMLFNSPSELQFYFIDPKGPTSDFYSLYTPHVRGFKSSMADILELLRYLTEDEAKRREKILSETGNGYVNIEDFKKDHPSYNIPYIVVVIDEIMTLASSASKEDKALFFSYLKSFVTRLPGYGMRLVLIPHLVKNSVVDKSVTDMIPNKIVVKADAKTIEDTLDVKPKEFPFTLTHVGDMAVKFADAVNVHFVHSAILGSTNGAYSHFFDFLTELWLKLDSGSFKGSKLHAALLDGSVSLTTYNYLEGILSKEEYDELRNAIVAQKLKRK